MQPKYNAMKLELDNAEITKLTHQFGVVCTTFFNLKVVEMKKSKLARNVIHKKSPSPREC